MDEMQQQENGFFHSVETRSASKRRTTGLLASDSKRKALAPLTNQQEPVGSRLGKKAPQQEDKLALPLPPHLDSLFSGPPLPSFSTDNILFFSQPSFTSRPPLSLATTTTNSLNLSAMDSSYFSGCSMSNNSFSFSASFRSLGSPDSPMVLYSPNTSIAANTSTVLDIDVLDDNDMIGLGPYARDIFTYLKESEAQHHPSPTYMRKQPDITHAMRSILVDWMVEVNEEFNLDPQTFFLAVSYADRYLSRMSVMRSKLQLLGTACMYVSAKFEEIYPPDIGEFSYITDDTYNKKQIVIMEQQILKVLNYHLATPTVYTFLQRFLKVSCSEHGVQEELINQQVAALSMFLCELAAQDGDPFLKYLPSVMAASAVCLARHTLSLEPWSSLLQHYSGYLVSELSQCLQDLHRAHALAHCHAQQAIRTKYSKDKFLRVALHKSPETLPY